MTSEPSIKDSHRDDDEAEGSGVAGITALRRDVTRIKRERRRSGKRCRKNVVNVLNIFSLKYVNKGNTFYFRKENKTRHKSSMMYSIVQTRTKFLISVELK